MTEADRPQALTSWKLLRIDGITHEGRGVKHLVDPFDRCSGSLAPGNSHAEHP